jgi:hypothetical protein
MVEIKRKLKNPSKSEPNKVMVKLSKTCDEDKEKNP